MSHKLQWIQNKIAPDARALVQRCQQWRTTGKKIVFTNGCFDILHYGHLHLLASAADMGNMLVVGLNSDQSVQRLKGAERPLTPEDKRAFQLASLLCVDAVCLFEQDTPQDLIQQLRPDVLVKGGDYTIDKIVGADFVNSYGGSVEVIPFIEGHSTTGLIEKIKSL